MDRSFTSLVRKKSSTRLSIGKRINSDPDIIKEKARKTSDVGVTIKQSNSPR